ncbi:hypothetical protein Pmani_007146 [Petrolisthes manimaculis]|uniref:Uncharacterized protein n=1 Tax=Petrolisthes manimaculis TaxID=1843537 RepID=A0AAE1Q996_9EUCA|nr:hypothetical protein Pmani_007144 [Petrolisthes manimaculis]KAK4322093.1 hypothetical protein Pmani_007146 [Petrolisthes manimaculis]
MNQSHGGEALYLREDLAVNAETLVTFSNGTTELLAVDLNFFSNKIDWEKVRSGIGRSDWAELMQGRHIDEALNILQHKCFEICKDFIPLKPSNAKKTRKHILMKKRVNLKSKLKKTNYAPRITKLEDELVGIENKLLQSHQEERTQNELQAVSNIQVNSKFFFTYAKKRLKTPSSIGPLEDANGEFESDPLNMARILKLQYETVFSPPKQESIINYPRPFFNEHQTLQQGQMAFMHNCLKIASTN